MKIEDWLQWPTRSTDPAMNAAIAVFLAVVIIFALIVGATVLIPIAIVIGIAKGVQWYVNRPVPTDQLYSQTQQRSIGANFPDTEKFMDAYLDRLLDAIRDDLPVYQVFQAMAQIAEELYKEERLSNPLPPLPPANTIEEGRYRDQLIAHQRKSVDAPRTLEVFHTTLGKTYLDLIAALPSIAKATPQEFSKCGEAKSFATFPLLDVLPDAGTSVRSVMLPFFIDDVEQIGLFASLRRQLDRNFQEASGAEHTASASKLITPDKHKGTAREIVSAYLHDTPLEALFYAPIPFSFTDEQRFEHTHVVGGSGHGKTQLLQHLILNDLQREKPPALIIIDSQGEMLNKIQRLDLFAPGKPLSERLIIINPEDATYPPALNMFDVKTARTGASAEQVEATTISLFNYIFSSIAAELTSRQNTTFSYVTRLMLSIPGSTINTLRELFEDGAKTVEGSPFDKHIKALDPTSQAYFRNQFFTSSYTPTKQLIARRLYSVLQVPAFERMFSSKENKLDMFAAMQSGKIILVNTSRLLLQDDASRLFGRYFIALALKAAYDRVAIPERQRYPAFLIVDEAAEYFDETIEELLNKARKSKLGVLVAHQSLQQRGMTTGLRAAIASCTTIKLAGGVSDSDGRALSNDMRTEPDFIASMKKRARSTEFACYVRNYTANAVRLQIPFFSIESAPTMSDEGHATLLARNRAQYAVQSIAPIPQPKPEDPQSGTKPQPPPRTGPEEGSTDAASKW